MEKEKENNIGEYILSLFDLYWFFPTPPSRPPAPAAPPPGRQQPPLLHRRHRRSKSDESLAAISTDLQIQTAKGKLDTILSGKEGFLQQPGEVTKRTAVQTRRRRREKLEGASSRSFTDFEFEELKGFRDIGFTFTEADAEADPRLVHILPGLRPQSSDNTTAAAQRPYWWEKTKHEWLTWKIQAPAGDDSENMKELLKMWAHNVASAVR